MHSSCIPLEIEYVSYKVNGIPTILAEVKPNTIIQHAFNLGLNIPAAVSLGNILHYTVILGLCSTHYNMCQRTVLDVTTIVMAALQHLFDPHEGGHTYYLYSFPIFPPGRYATRATLYSSCEIRVVKFVLCGYVCTLYVRCRSE